MTQVKAAVAAALCGVAIVLALSPAAARVDAQAGASGRVRVVHMVPNTASVDLLVDGKVTFSNVAFKAISQYTPLPAGRHSVEVTAAGQDNRPLYSMMATVAGGTDATIVAVGSASTLRLVTLTDDNVPSPPAGQAKVRVFHASPDTGGVDVSAVNGPMLARDVGFTAASPYVYVPAGTYDLQFTPTGASTVVLRVPNIELQSGQVATIFATGLSANQSLAAVPTLNATKPTSTTDSAAAATPAAGGATANSTPAAAGTSTSGAADIRASVLTMPATGTGGGRAASFDPAWLFAALGALALSFGVGVALRRTGHAAA